MNVASLFAKATASRALAADIQQAAPAATLAPSIGTLQASAWAAPVTDAVKTISPAPSQAVEVTRTAAPAASGLFGALASVFGTSAPRPTIPGVRLLYFTKSPPETPYGQSIWGPGDFAGGQLLGEGMPVGESSIYPIGSEAQPSGFTVYRDDPSGDGNRYQTRTLGFNADGSVFWTQDSWASQSRLGFASFMAQGLALAAAVFTAGQSMTAAMAAEGAAGAAGAAAGSTVAVDSAIGGTGLTATAGNGLTLAAETGAGAGLTATPGLGLTLAAPTGTGAGLALTTGQATFAASVGASVAAWDAAAAAAALPTSASTALAPASVDSAIGGTGLTATPGQGLTLAEATGTGTGLTATAGQGLTLAEATGTGAGFTLAQAVNAVKTIPVVKGLVDAVTGVSAAPGATQGQVQAKPVTQAAAPLLLLAAAAGAFFLIRK